MEANNSIICPNCGAICQSHQKFCGVCGTELTIRPNDDSRCRQGKNEQNTKQSYDSRRLVITENDLAEFICDNQIYYRNKFQRMRRANSKASWNWAAFLFGGCWFAYRKMYGVCGVFFCISLIIDLFLRPGFITAVLGLLQCICCGIFGNYIYMRYAETEIMHGKCFNDTMKKYYFLQKGGTKDIAVFIYLAICIVFFIFLNVLKNIFWLYYA